MCEYADVQILKHLNKIKRPQQNLLRPFYFSVVDVPIPGSLFLIPFFGSNSWFLSLVSCPSSTPLQGAGGLISSSLP